MKPTADDERALRFFRAIAAGNATVPRTMLRAEPELATRAIRVGASRAAARPFFLDEIGRYVYTGDTALHIAAGRYATDVAKRLVTLGADVTARNRRGATPLHAAAAGAPGSPAWRPRAQSAMVAYLIGAGADANATDASGVTPLHVAVRTRCSAAVRALLEHGAAPNRRNGSGTTPLKLAHISTGRGGSGSDAAKREQREIVRLLDAHGANARPPHADPQRKTR